MEIWSYNEAFGPGENWDAQYGKGFGAALEEFYGKKIFLLKFLTKQNF